MRNRHINTKRDAKRTLGVMKVLYRIYGEDPRAYYGLLDVIQFDDPCLSLFLESDETDIILSSNSQNKVTIYYSLDDKMVEDEVSFNEIQFFRNAIRNNLEKELEKRRN